MGTRRKKHSKRKNYCCGHNLEGDWTTRYIGGKAGAAVE